MMARTHLIAWGKRARGTGRVQALINRCRASGVLDHAVNFAKGILIGGSIVLFVWLNID
jgi:hypothetical protein